MAYLFSGNSLKPLSDLLSLDDFTAEDFVLATILALFFTWLILSVTRLFNAVMKRPAELQYQSKDMGKLLQRCYTLFPNETILFRGKTYSRGMNIKVTTANNKTFEGKLIGQNSDNILCVMTKTFIAADIIDNVTEIEVTDIQNE